MGGLTGLEKIGLVGIPVVIAASVVVMVVLAAAVGGGSGGAGGVESAMLWCWRGKLLGIFIRGREIL